MSEDQDRAKELEFQASKLIDRADSDEEALDRAAEILAEAERLRGPISWEEPGRVWVVKVESERVSTMSRVQPLRNAK
jgi:hypothetical protein